MFKKDGKRIKWLLICSSCHEILDFELDYK
jgi:hypothetical protein